MRSITFIIVSIIFSLEALFGQVKIIISEGASIQANHHIRSNSFKIVKSLPILGLQILEFSSQKDANEYIQQKKLSPDQWIGNVALETRQFPTNPNDPLLNKQWHLFKIGADKAWNEYYTTKRTRWDNDAVIGIIDNGYRITHEDLAENVWINSDEIIDGKDNDDNGYIDDRVGLSLLANTTHPIDTPPHVIKSHGTLVAGIAAGVSDNNKGIASTVPSIKILLASADITNLANVLELYEYMAAQKSKYIKSKGTKGANIVVINYSGGLSFAKAKDYPIWCTIYDKLGALGILSVGVVANKDIDVEEDGDMPTSCKSPYLITSTYTDSTDRKALGSGFSKKSIDLGVPGEKILSTSPLSDRAYTEFSGNSAAGPILASSIALHYFVANDLQGRLFILDHPERIALLIKNSIIQSVDKNPDLAKYTVSGGRLNLFRSIHNFKSKLETIKSKIPGFTIYQFAPNTLVIKDIHHFPDSASEFKFLLFDNIGKKIVDHTFAFKDLQEITTNIPVTGIYHAVLVNKNAYKSQKLFLKTTQ